MAGKDTYPYNPALSRNADYHSSLLEILLWSEFINESPNYGKIDEVGEDSNNKKRVKKKV